MLFPQEIHRAGRSMCYNVLTNLSTLEEAMRKAAPVGVRELSSDTSKILRRVREKGESIDIAYRGRVVARIVPAAPPAPDPKALSAVWADLDRVAEEIGRRWPKRVSAAQAVSETRR